jgi:hypothetical protein
VSAITNLEFGARILAWCHKSKPKRGGIHGTEVLMIIAPYAIKWCPGTKVFSKAW